MIQFVKGFITFIKGKYGYLAQRFTKEKMSEVSKRVQNKQSNKIVSDVSNKKVIDYNYEKRYIFPSYEAFDKSIKAFVE